MYQIISQFSWFMGAIGHRERVWVGCPSEKKGAFLAGYKRVEFIVREECRTGKIALEELQMRNRRGGKSSLGNNGAIDKGVRIVTSGSGAVITDLRVCHFQNIAENNPKEHGVIYLSQ